MSGDSRYRMRVGAIAGEGLLYRPRRGSFPGDTIIINIVHKICNFYFSSLMYKLQK